MSSGVENVIRGDEEVVKVSGELGEKNGERSQGTPKGGPHAKTTISIPT